jgi:hypothetical protein
MSRRSCSADRAVPIPRAPVDAALPVVYAGFMKRGTVILVSALAALSAHAQPAPAFPNIKSADLNGRSLSLPDDFPAPSSLVFVAFEMRQQADVDSWHTFVEQARKKRPALGVFEFPTMARRYRLMQFVIDNGMRSGIPDRETRAATVTLYTDVTAFTKALGIGSTKEISVLVVTPAGAILAHHSRRYTEEAAAPIERALSAGG